MTFVNSFWDGENLVFFDQEWNYSDIPLKYILYRAVKYAYRENQNISLKKINEYIGIDENMIQSFDNAENEMLSAMMDKQKCDMFDPNMYHDALTLQFKQKQFADGYQEVISRCEKVEGVLDNSERELEEKKRELEEKKRELEEKKQEIIFQNSRIVKTENEIKNLKQTICNKEGHIEQLLEVAREYKRE